MTGRIRLLCVGLLAAVWQLRLRSGHRRSLPASRCFRSTEEPDMTGRLRLLWAALFATVAAAAAVATPAVLAGITFNALD
jgi:hypothetical protein